MVLLSFLITSLVPLDFLPLLINKMVLFFFLDIHSHENISWAPNCPTKLRRSSHLPCGNCRQRKNCDIFLSFSLPFFYFFLAPSLWVGGNGVTQGSEKNEKVPRWPPVYISGISKKKSVFAIISLNWDYTEDWSRLTLHRVRQAEASSWHSSFKCFFSLLWATVLHPPSSISMLFFWMKLLLFHKDNVLGQPSQYSLLIQIQMICINLPAHLPCFPTDARWGASFHLLLNAYPTYHNALYQHHQLSAKSNWRKQKTLGWDISYLHKASNEETSLTSEHI